MMINALLTGVSPIIHYSLFTIHYSLCTKISLTGVSPIIHYSLFTIHFGRFTFHFGLSRD